MSHVCCHWCHQHHCGDNLGFFSDNHQNLVQKYEELQHANTSLQQELTKSKKELVKLQKELEVRKETGEKLIMTMTNDSERLEAGVKKNPPQSLNYSIYYQNSQAHIFQCNSTTYYITAMSEFI